jgi:hypothetical protein
VQGDRCGAFQEGHRRAGHVATGDRSAPSGRRAGSRAQLAKDQAQLQNALNNEKRLRSVYEQKLTSLEQSTRRSPPVATRGGGPSRDDIA